MQYLLIGFWLGAISAFVVFAGLEWMNRWTDARLDAQYAEYSACVIREYGVPPHVYYAEHGEVPECL